MFWNLYNRRARSGFSMNHEQHKRMQSFVIFFCAFYCTYTHIYIYRLGNSGVSVTHSCHTKFRVDVSTSILNILLSSESSFRRVFRTSLFVCWGGRAEKSCDHFPMELRTVFVRRKLNILQLPSEARTYLFFFVVVAQQSFLFSKSNDALVCWGIVLDMCFCLFIHRIYLSFGTDTVSCCDGNTLLHTALTFHANGG